MIQPHLTFLQLETVLISCLVFMIQQIFSVPSLVTFDAALCYSQLRPLTTNCQQPQKIAGGNFRIQKKNERMLQKYKSVLVMRQAMNLVLVKVW